MNRTACEYTLVHTCVRMYVCDIRMLPSNRIDLAPSFAYCLSKMDSFAVSMLLPLLIEDVFPAQCTYVHA